MLLTTGCMGAITATIGQLQCAASIGLLLQLYKTCVPPTGLYGSEVWGPYRLSAPLSSTRESLGLSHLQILKHVVGVRSTMATAILMKELEVQPFENESWLRAVRFWDNLVSLPDATFYKRIALDAC